MNTSHIKAYAPKARRDFIAAISKQAAKYGISAKQIEPLEIKGDLAIIGGKPFPLAVAKPREALIQKIQLSGFNPIIEQVAYSWFNRLCAIRYMELADYLGHGRSVLSHPQQVNGYQILEECLDIDLPGLDQAKVRALKLDGSKDEELYRMLLLAQCHALHTAMPFLFEPVDDETELLLPENLTKTDSLIRDLVSSIPKDDWDNIEIIGWLYQFYISEKKDQVIGKVVKSEDIPAATQLFTPNWIVKYMVQNSLGAQWLSTYPDSPLKAQMEYYIEPAEQTDEVNAQLKEITPLELNPEELTLIDPACGSGHILVEAYELFKAIYLERGYRQRDVPSLILEKNLFGLDIDQRAAQLTGFALMMKGRADDRRLFERGVKLNVMALVDSTGFDAEALADFLPRHSQEHPRHSRAGGNPEDTVQMSDLTELKRLFEHATTFGSLIQVPEELASSLSALKHLSEVESQDLFVSDVLKRLAPLVQQAELLTSQYDAVVANPPYLSSKGMSDSLKKFAKNYYPDAKSDLFSCFMQRGFSLASASGYNTMVTMQSWMFLGTFAKLRESILTSRTVSSLMHIGYNSFPTLNSKIAQACAFSIRGMPTDNYRGRYINLNSAEPSADKNLLFLERRDDLEFAVDQQGFKNIPGSPVAFWISEDELEAFSSYSRNGDLCTTSNGVQTGNNELFVREWFEVCQTRIGKKWFPYNKGGPYKKWYGNAGSIVDWEHGGSRIKNQANSCCRGEEHFFQPSITWTDVTWRVSARYLPAGHVSDAAGPCAHFSDDRDAYFALGIFNTPIIDKWSKVLNPTLHFQAGDFKKIPFPESYRSDSSLALIQQAINITRVDLESSEVSASFLGNAILSIGGEPTKSLLKRFKEYADDCDSKTKLLKGIEKENLSRVLSAFEVSDRKPPDILDEWITLTVNPAYRYGGKLTEEELWNRFRKDTMQELVSYTIGCMMGRYSLDEPGLIYAHSGNEGFAPSRYSSFSADDDGIVPLTDIEWFDDDAANRLFEFISVTWDKVHLEENLNFLADNLSPKRGEGSRDTVRRYLSNQFFKDHCQTYKKRPIYWLFSSGKEKAFQCLVYLHRYNEGTLARMRTEYVIPLTAKLSTHVQKLEKDVEASSTTAEIKKLEKEIARLHKQQAELSSFDEKLRHYADQRIHLDLDDGVKVNYGKFGDLLAEVKAIHGKKPEID